MRIEMEQPMVIDASRGGYPWLASLDNVSTTQVHTGDPFKDEYTIDFGKVVLTGTYYEWAMLFRNVNDLFLSASPHKTVDSRHVFKRPARF